MVVIFATAVFGQSEIKPLDAPKCLADWLMQNMDGFKIDKLYKIDKKGEISYVAKAVKEKQVQWLFIKPDCSAVKKISAAEVESYFKPVTESNSKPMIHPKPPIHPNVKALPPVNTDPPVKPPQGPKK